MGNTNLLIAIAFILTLFVHNFVFFELVRRILDKRRFSIVVIVVVCALNSVLCYFAMVNTGTVDSMMYLNIAIVLTLEFVFCFSNSIIGIVTCSSAIIMHILAVHSIVSAVFSMIAGISIYDVMHTGNYYWYVTILSLLLHLVILVLVMKIIPERYLKIINQNKEFSIFLCMLCCIFLAYTIYDSRVFMIDADYPGLAVRQLISPIVLLSGIYIGVAMMIKMVNLYGYKAKSDELAKRIDKEKQYKMAFMDRMQSVLEINCTKDRVQYCMRGGKDIELPPDFSYTSYASSTASSLVHPDDIASVIPYASSSMLKQNHEKGNTDYDYEYRASSGGEYIWYRANITSHVNSEGDVIAIMSVSDINDEKTEELSLRYQAERDSLTGAYNKEYTARYVDTYLQNGGIGALFMLDLDNFKGVNDNFGHAYGDVVLQDTYGHIEKIFRDHDVIGRIGGDKYIVFMKNVISEGIISEKAKNICAALMRDFLTPSDEIVHVSASVGIAVSPDHGTTFEELYKAADSAMYHAKGRSKNTFHIYEPGSTPSYSGPRAR